MIPPRSAFGRRNGSTANIASQQPTLSIGFEGLAALALLLRQPRPLKRALQVTARKRYILSLFFRLGLGSLNDSLTSLPLSTLTSIRGDTFCIFSPTPIQSTAFPPGISTQRHGPLASGVGLRFYRPNLHRLDRPFLPFAKILIVPGGHFQISGWSVRLRPLTPEAGLHPGCLRP